MAAATVELLYKSTHDVVAHHRVHSDFRDYPVDRVEMGQGCVLRLDLLLRGSGGDDGGHASPQDAPWSLLEPSEHDRAGISDAGDGVFRHSHCWLGGPGGFMAG